ncbi:MAG: chorismate synthase [Candidatus Methylomirabilales bacterium]|nr:chorismate synthase [candidate division NC10 bacterium]
MLRYLTAGESHGPSLTTIVEGMPANLPLSPKDIDVELSRRQMGYGRGGRMKIEQDRVSITAGVRHGVTLGSPITLIITNRDFTNWQETMGIEVEVKVQDTRPPVTRPRPGHADLAGAIKYGHRDIRNVLERSSARETTARVAVGAVCKRLLREFGISVLSHVVEIGGVRASRGDATPEQIQALAEASPVRCVDREAAEAMVAKIDEARRRKTTLGGIFEIIVEGVPVGLGSYVQWDRKLDGRLARALMSIQAIKGVEVGFGFTVAGRFGFEAHDEIFYDPERQGPHGLKFYRKTNYAGGLEGGVTNGEPILLRAAMKPLSTQYAPLRSVDLETKEPFEATVERSDVCAVPAAGVIGEGVVAFEVANALREKFGGDSLEEMKRNFDTYARYVRER